MRIATIPNLTQWPGSALVIDPKWEAISTRLLNELTKPLERHRLRALAYERYLRVRTPIALILKGSFSLSLGISAKLRIGTSAIMHPGRLKYLYWPW